MSLTHTFIRWQKNVWDSFQILVQTSSVQTFPPIIIFYIRSNVVISGVPTSIYRQIESN